MNADLMERVTSLRTAIAKVKTDLDAVVAAEAELAEALRAAGLDDAITSVDLPTVAGLPSRRKKPRPADAPGELSTMRAAAAGAGLMLGVSIVVLLAINLVRQPSSTPAPIAVASALPSVTPVVITPVATVSPIPPPEPVTTVAPSSEPTKPEKPEMGALTILCTPRCDAITDNGVPLAPGNLVGVPAAAGPHRIEARGNGVKRTYSVTVASGQTREVKVTLEPSPDRGF